jgi:uncharacterized membrane protein
VKREASNVDQVLLALDVVATIGAALIAGVFFAFSTFVMKALARLPAHEGIAAMQSINVAVINPRFLGVFIGTALICVIAMIGALMRWEKPGTVYLLSGGALYLLGTFGVTVLFNVPLNNKLAGLEPAEPGTDERWGDYVRQWTRWNHVRTAAALAAAVSFLLAIYR